MERFLGAWKFGGLCLSAFYLEGSCVEGLQASGFLSLPFIQHGALEANRVKGRTAVFSVMRHALTQLPAQIILLQGGSTE